MDRESLFKHLNHRYCSKHKMLSRIPLGVQPDALWQELLQHRRTQSTALPIYAPNGNPYWYVTTDRMIAASEKIVETLYTDGADFDPFTEPPPIMTPEKSFFTSYVEGAQITMQAAMDFLASGEQPRDIEEQMIANNRTAGKFATENLYRGIDTEFLRGLAYLLTDGMNDIDNERKDIPSETPEHVAEVLARYNLKAAFMYETFNSTPDDRRFRFALVSDTEFTDKAERDRLQAAIIAAFPQSDIGCTNADRIYFGTDKGLIVGFTDFAAVCAKDDLMAFADEFYLPETLDEDPINPASAKSVGTIPVGQRHNTLISFASAMLKKYGVCEQACEAYMERVGQCEEPMPEDHPKDYRF